jgi:Chaperone of endosialidase
LPLESATYVSQLVSTNPAGTDQISQSDDHLRLIKSTLLQSFPNVSGAVTATHSQINTAALNPIAGTTGAADTIPYYTGTSTAATTAFTSAARSLLSQTSAAAMLTYLGASGSSNTAFTNASNTFSAAQTMNAGLTISNSGSNMLALNDTTGNATHLAFKQSGVAKGYIGATATYAFYASNASGGTPIYADQSGNFTATANIAAYSDVRLKTNIQTITDALDIVDELRGVWYTRTDSGADRVGLIAQEVDEVLPEVIVENPETGYLAISYGDIVGVLVEAIKELKAKVEALEAR